MRGPLRVAVLWSRFGPYHLARLRAAATAGAEVAGVEVARTDAIYAWAPVEAGDVPRTTLFPGRAYEDLSRGEIASAVFRALDALAPDAVAINGWTAPEALAGLAWAERRRRVAVLMSETKADDAPRAWWKEAMKRRIVARCDAALVGGRAHGDYLAALGFPRERIRVGYDVVDNAHFRAGAERARAAPRPAGLPERYFLACTRFVARKNVDGLLKAYALYRARAAGARWSLVIAGSGADEAGLRALAGDGVLWPGFIQYDALPTYYGLASAFVHAAKSEPWGLVVNEAIASGLPALVSRTAGACGELIADGENGYAFDPCDDEALARAMNRVCEMSDARRAAMERASLAIAELWTPQRFGVELLAAVHMGKRRTSARQAA